METKDLNEDGDWFEALACAKRDGARGVLGYAGPVAMFEPGDVAEVLAASEGENDETSWIAAFRLRDGRFAFLSAWCDYTGWGCRDGGDVQFAATLDDLIRLAMTNEERERLGYTVV